MLLHHEDRLTQHALNLSHSAWNVDSTRTPQAARPHLSICHHVMDCLGTSFPPVFPYPSASHSQVICKSDGSIVPAGVDAPSRYPSRYHAEPAARVRVMKRLPQWSNPLGGENMFSKTHQRIQLRVGSGQRRSSW